MGRKCLCQEGYEIDVPAEIMDVILTISTNQRLLKITNDLISATLPCVCAARGIYFSVHSNSKNIVDIH